MAQNQKKNSQLYTHKDIAAQKQVVVNRLGKDSDGAYRASRRIDGKA